MEETKNVDKAHSLEMVKVEDKMYFVTEDDREGPDLSINLGDHAVHVDEGFLVVKDNYM